MKPFVYSQTSTFASVWLDYAMIVRKSERLDCWWIMA